MDRNEVNPTDHISPIILVLQRPVNCVIDYQFEHAEEDYRYEKDLEVFSRIDCRKRYHGARVGHAEKTEGEADFQQDAIDIVLARIHAWQTSQYKDCL